MLMHTTKLYVMPFLVALITRTAFPYGEISVFFNLSVTSQPQRRTLRERPYGKYTKRLLPKSSSLKITFILI